jgi:hypothetical protein
MKKHSLKLAVLCAAVLASGLIARPAPAQPGPTQPIDCLAVLMSRNARTWIEITNGGITGTIYCHTAIIGQDGDEFTVEGTPTLCGEAFKVCVGNAFEVGSNPYDGLVNLDPASPAGKGNESLNRPFWVKGTKVIFLLPAGTAPGCDDAPVYDLDNQDLDGDGDPDGPLPLGAVVNLITENRPSSEGGKCIGVRTTFQHIVSTCKLCKVRKYFNTCRSAKTLTQVKEFEQVCDDARMGQLFSATGGTLTAVAQTLPFLHQKQITLTTSNTGANPVNANPKLYQPSAAGSVCDIPYFFGEFDTCRLLTGTDPCLFTSAQVIRPAGSWLELFLSWFPGGVKLQPYGSKTGGFEKFVTFCIDVQ